MEAIDRRSALAFGLATAATLPALLTPTPASAQRYRPDEGREIAPGVRRVDLTKRASEIPAYATVSMRDIVYQPGAKSGMHYPVPKETCPCPQTFKPMSAASLLRLGVCGRAVYAPTLPVSGPAC
jgi:hypothetical protein